MDTLTPEQSARQTKRHREHWQRQARMPKDKRPRISPQQNIPGKPWGVYMTDYTSMRTCVEHPELHPNDFQYLFRLANRPPGEVTYIWLDMEGQNRQGTTYPSLYAALKPFILAGWEDASW